ncbi:murein hydrolase activator EnvC family protein [Halodurantibacterium flavum]|uniref:Murein hydrolase activator EnvC family protein n=1 Tax=Halodurantibacterium flavum TaxID=1382802 RepID=A0ABW4S365_9RHOB
MKRLIAAFLATALGLSAAHGQTGQDAAEMARAAARDLAASIGALQEAANDRDRVAALTRTIRSYEDGLVAVREGLRRLSLREAAIREDWETQRDSVARLVAVMTTMENNSGPMLLLHPTGPVGTARSGIILSDVAPALQAEAETLRRDLEEVAGLRRLQESLAITLEEGLHATQEARTALAQAISERRDLPQKFAERPDELRLIVQSIDTLDSFSDLLSDTQIGPQDLPLPFSAREGDLPLPVNGPILRGFNEPDAAGTSRPGILIAAPAGGLVTAPAPATIRYMGPLLDYGNVMILEPEGGYFLVLAGMDVLYGELGQVVPEGSPLGLMPGSAISAAEFVAEAQAGAEPDGSETLYVEIRRLNRPTDPAVWFAQTGE